MSPEVIVDEARIDAVRAAVVAPPAVAGDARARLVALGEKVTIFVDALDATAAVGIERHEDQTGFGREARKGAGVVVRGGVAAGEGTVAQHGAGHVRAVAVEVRPVGFAAAFGES